MARRPITSAQLTLFRRGGRRVGAGRKRSSARPRVAHRTRARVTRHHPVFVTTRVRDGLPSLRGDHARDVVQRVLAAGADRFGFKLVEYSIQSNHLHVLAEAPDERVLARGMQGLLVRVARALNRAWNRRGAVVSDRYHARVLRTPREVRHALVYVLNNARKHGAHFVGVDACSSGPWFTGWTDRAALASSPLPRAVSWLMTIGWRRNGGIATSASPLSKLRV